MTTFAPVSLAKHLIIAFAVFVLGSIPALSQTSVFVDVAPPALPMYEQPACPDNGYLWTPGFWAYGDYGYYWVPGTWVQPPEVGLLWTPAYWGWNNSGYAFFPGYWGTNVGFYGGVNYGYGYGGNGYGGGRWQHGNFFYNTAVNNVHSASIRNRYADTTFSRNAGGVSYNGGRGGIQAKPTSQDRQFASQRHFQATSVQVTHVHAASLDRGQLASANGGRPTTAAVATVKSYKRVAQQRAQSQPLTKQSAPKQRGVNSAQTHTEISPSPQFNPQRQTPPVNQYAPPAESHTPMAKPNDRSATVNPQPRETLQPRPEMKTKAQPRSGAEAKPQPRPEVQSKPQPRAEAKAQPRPDAAAQPGSNKPESH